VSAAAPRVVIVGAGLSGLAAGCVLARRGIAVSIVERNAFTGGYNSCLALDGYRFDIGATMLHTPEILHETLAAIGAPSDALRIQPLDPLYRVRFHDGRTLDLLPSVEGTAERIAAFSPADARAFRRYVADVDAVRSSLRRLLMEHDSAALALRPYDALRVLGRLRPHRSVASLMHGYFASDEVRKAMTFQTLYFGASPEHVSALHAMVPYFEVTRGVWHVEGGMHEISRTLTETFLAAGGELRTEAEVARIVVHGRRAAGVELIDGERLDADAVLAAANTVHACLDLLPPQALPARARRQVARLTRSCSAQLTLLGVDAADLAPDLVHHTFILPGDFARHCHDLFDRGRMSTQTSIYVSVPSVGDPAVAPPGRAAVYALVLAPHAASAEPWAERRDELGERVVADLRAHGILRGERPAHVREVLVPSDLAARFNQPGGMGFGIAPTFRQTGPLRPGARSRHVAALYFAGASTNPGCGVPMVLTSGRSAADAIAADLDRAPRERRAPALSG